MSLDGAVIYNLKNEISRTLEDGRIDKIAQPSKHEIIIHIRAKGQNKKLMISASSSTPRIHFTETSPENPQSPPMFCMLLRKHLAGSKFVGITQNGMDRVLSIALEGYNELGDRTVFLLIIEIMGRHSNIILIDENRKIIDSVKRIDFNTSSVRQVLPGMIYENPPVQDKLNILETSTDAIIGRIKLIDNKILSKAILDVLEGFSPLPAREIADIATNGNDDIVSNLTDDTWVSLEKELDHLRVLLKEEKTTATMLIGENGKPQDFSFIPINQYGSLMETEVFSSFSEMLDTFYQKREVIERISQRGGDLQRFLDNTLQRIVKRTSIQKIELEQCKDRDELRLFGDLLTANIHMLSKGDSSATVQNYYDPEAKNIEIPLDIRKSPAQNAQYYFSQYRKAATAEEKLTLLIQEGEDEIVYIESVIDTLKRAQTSADIEAIREELFQTGYLKKKKDKKRQKPQKQSPMEFVSSDGFKIYAGRNNTQNDKLSLKDSQSNDIWLHTQKIPGSHIIISTQGKEVPESTLLEAATIAAYHSKAQDSTKVPVDYTKVRYVKKPSGAKPGMVNYDNFKTLFVDPDESLVKSLEK